MSLGADSGSGSDSEPIVRIAYDGGEVAAPVAPRPVEPPPRRAAAALLLGLATVLGLLFWLDRDQGGSSADPPEAAAEEPAGDEPAADAPLPNEDLDSVPETGPLGELDRIDVEQQPISDMIPPHLITSIAPRRMVRDDSVDEWVGVLALDDRLISSTDGGFTWSLTNLNAGEVVAVGIDDEGGTTMVMGRHEPDALTLDTWTAISSGWGRNGRWPSIGVGSGDVIDTATGERTVVIIEDAAGLAVLVATPDGDVERFQLDLGTLPVEVSLETIRTGDRLVAHSDGSLILLTPGGIHRATAPYDEWVLLTNGPFDRALSGQRFGIPLFGSGFFANDPRGTGVFSATCCGNDAESADNWSVLSTAGREFSRVLISTDTTVIFQAANGEIVEVVR